MGQRGMHRVLDGTLTWTADGGNTMHPRKASDGSDVSLTAEKKERMHGIRDAWRRSMWMKWTQTSLRYDAGIARAREAGWNPG
eukprot:9603797-Alexandrium_andersonii.AAC.1